MATVHVLSRTNMEVSPNPSKRAIETYHRAAAEAKKCIEVDPSWLQGYSRLGLALFNVGDYAGAVEAYREGLVNCVHGRDHLRRALQIATDAQSRKERREQLERGCEENRRLKMAATLDHTATIHRHPHAQPRSHPCSASPHVHMHHESGDDHDTCTPEYSSESRSTSYSQTSRASTPRHKPRHSRNRQHTLQSVWESLCSGEANYRVVLTACLEVYYGRLQTALHVGFPLLSMQDMDAVFFNLEQVFQLSERLWNRLEDAPPPTLDLVLGIIGDFNDDFQQIYVAYYKNRSRAVATLRKLNASNYSNRRAWQRFLAVEAELNGGIRLERMLPLPMRRLEHYLNVLQQLKGVCTSAEESLRTRFARVIPNNTPKLSECLDELSVSCTHVLKH